MVKPLRPIHTMRFVVITCSIQLISHHVNAKNGTNLSQLCQGNEVVAQCRSRLILQIAPCEQVFISDVSSIFS